MSFISRGNGGSLNYAENGSGPTLVFVHGWGMSRLVWKFQEEYFHSSYRVVTIDLRGHGDSPLTSGDGFSMNDFAGDLVSLIRGLDLSHATLVGWSLGAQVVLQAYKAARASLAALVLVGGSPRFCSGDGFEPGLDPQEARGMALRLKRDKPRTMGDFFRNMFIEGEMSSSLNQRVAMEIVSPFVQPETSTLLKSLEGIVECDQRLLLPDIKHPTLLIHGAGDTTCLPGASVYMAAKIADAELSLMPGCGHAPFMSRPTEFNNVLASFLSRVYGGN